MASKEDPKSEWELLSSFDLQSNFVSRLDADEDFVFLLEPDCNLRCSICLEIATEPRQEEGCGKLFCAGCIAVHGETKPCPNCRASPKYFTDKKSLRDIKELRVKCKNYKIGCSWEGTLDTVEDHMSRVCEFKIVPCKFHTIGCLYMNIRKKIKLHEDKEDKAHLYLAMQAILKLSVKDQTLDSNQTKTIRMNNFSKYKVNQLEFHSDPFYTHYRGYRLELKVNANGTGHGNSTHISVFINVLESCYNRDLKWPFEGEVVVELLNQLEDSGHCRQVIAFTTANNVNPGIGRGFSQFILQTKLPKDPETNTEYLMNDTLYFRVKTKLDDYKPWLH